MTRQPLRRLRRRRGPPYLGAIVASIPALLAARAALHVSQRDGPGPDWVQDAIAWGVALFGIAITVVMARRAYRRWKTDRR